MLYWRAVLSSCPKLPQDKSTLNAGYFITLTQNKYELTTEFELSISSTPDPNSSSISVSVA